MQRSKGQGSDPMNSQEEAGYGWCWGDTLVMAAMGLQCGEQGRKTWFKASKNCVREGGLMLCVSGCVLILVP